MTMFEVSKMSTHPLDKYRQINAETISTTNLNIGGIPVVSSGSWTLSMPASYVIYSGSDGYYYSRKAADGTLASGSSATYVINNAISNTPSGGLIFLKVGLYNLTGSIIPKTNTTIDGEKGAILKMAATSNCHGVEILSKNSIIIRNIELDGNKTQQTTGSLIYGIHIWYSSQCLVENVYAHDWPMTGIMLGSYASKCEVKGCKVSNISSIWLSGSCIEASSYSSYNDIHDNIVTTNPCKLGIGTLYNVIGNPIHHNIIDDGGARSQMGIIVYQGYYNTVENNHIHSTYVWQSGEYYFPIEVYTDSYFNIVSGNTIQLDNNVAGALPSGIEIDTNSNSNIIIGNNVWAGSGSTWAGIILVDGNCSNNVISDNIVTGWNRGIEIAEPTDTYNIFTNNNLVNNTTPFDFEGGATATTQIIKNNIGYVTENYGTFNFTGTSGSIPHGLAIAPTIVNLTLTGAIGAPSTYRGVLSWSPSGSAGIWIIPTGSYNVGGTWSAQV